MPDAFLFTLVLIVEQEWQDKRKDMVAMLLFSSLFCCFSTDNEMQPFLFQVAHVFNRDESNINAYRRLLQAMLVSSHSQSALSLSLSFTATWDDVKGVWLSRQIDICRARQQETE
jgi:hypothetical protein